MHILAALISVEMTNWWPGGGGGETPDLRPGLEEDDISPGIEGFLFTALVVVLLLFVVRDLAKRTRRMKYRSQVEAEFSGEEPEFPGEIIPAEMSESQRYVREAAAADRFGPDAEAGPGASGADSDGAAAESAEAVEAADGPEALGVEPDDQRTR